MPGRRKGIKQPNPFVKIDKETTLTLSRSAWSESGWKADAPPTTTTEAMIYCLPKLLLCQQKFYSWNETNAMYLLNIRKPRMDTGELMQLLSRQQKSLKREV